MRYGLQFSSPTSGVTKFLILIIASYLIFSVGSRTALGAAVYDAMMLSPYRVINSFELWRLFTYAFLHDLGSPMHVIFNALALYMIGTPLEERWGEQRFLIFVVVAILLGALLVVLSYLVGLSNARVVGLSAATIGLVIAWGMTFSDQQIFIFGIIPLTGRQLVYTTIGLEILYAVSSSSISSAAHFGGILAGFIFTLGLYKPKRLKQMWQSRRRFH